MKLPKCLDKIVKVAALGSALLFTPLQANSDFYFYGNLGLGLEAGTPTAQVQTVPLEIRDVPAHPDDSSLSIAPIKDSEVTHFPYTLNLEAKVGVGFEGDNFDIRIGPKAGLVLTGNFSWPIERNYTNDPGSDTRGTGAALTYYNLQKEGLAFIPGASARVSIPLGNQLIGFAEYSVDFLHQLFMENGWDRYDKFEVRKTYKLADLIDHTIKVGINFPMGPEFASGEAYIGVTIPQIIDKTDLADETKLEVSPSFLVGLKFGLDVNTK